MCLKALAWALNFSKFASKLSVWGLVWGLTWIWQGFTKPVGNQPCALRLWFGPLTFPIWLLSLLFGLGFGGWPGFGQVLSSLLEISFGPCGSGLGPLLLQVGS